MISVLLCLLFWPGDEPVETTFADVHIEEPFDEYLLANSLLMEVTGSKIIRRRGDEFVVIGVASTVLKDGSPKDRLRAEKVCRVKALASIVGEKQGIQIAHLEQVKEATVVVIEDGQETASSVSEFLQVTKAKVEGVAKDMPVVGTWKSQDRKIFYLAIGAILDKQKEPIQLDESSDDAEDD